MQPADVCCALDTESSLSSINSTNAMVTFGTITAIGNAVMRLEVDEIELISGNWSRNEFTIPVCGAYTTLTEHAAGSCASFVSPCNVIVSVFACKPRTFGSYHKDSAGPAGSDIGCLKSPNATNVQHITPNISNLHFHANSEHTRDGGFPRPLPCPALIMTPLKQGTTTDDSDTQRRLTGQLAGQLMALACRSILWR